MALEANEIQLDPEKRCEILGASPSASRRAVQEVFEAERERESREKSIKKRMSKYHGRAKVKMSSPRVESTQLRQSQASPWHYGSPCFQGQTEASRVGCAKEREGQ